MQRWTGRTLGPKEIHQLTAELTDLSERENAVLRIMLWRQAPALGWTMRLERKKTVADTWAARSLDGELEEHHAGILLSGKTLGFGHMQTERSNRANFVWEGMPRWPEDAAEKKAPAESTPDDHAAQWADHREKVLAPGEKEAWNTLIGWGKDAATMVKSEPVIWLSIIPPAAIATHLKERTDREK